jgi:ribulose-5-phosphate 4-epimerase/fuculose-1-phosphate aldolase
MSELNKLDPLANQEEAAMDDVEREGRADLAAAFRWAARLGYHEAVANHFSLAMSPDGSKFLLNPRWRHFSRVKASELLLLDADTKAVLAGEGPPDPTAWYIHSRLHMRLPHARCVLHCHSRYATVLASLKGVRMLPVDQNTARFYDRVAYDDTFNGFALDDAEGDRICAALGNKSIMVMANHGVTVAAASVAEAFDNLYYFERSCETFILALSTGKELNVLPDEVARRTAQQWQDYGDYSRLHFAELRRILDEEEPSYKH